MQNAHETCNVSAFSADQLKGELCLVESLGQEFRRVLVKYEHTLDEQHVREKLETLERWLESYRRGLKAAVKLAENAPDWLSNVSDRLRLAHEELLRLEGEGGIPAVPEQIEKTEALRKATRRLERVLPRVEQRFPHTEQIEA